MTSLLFLYHQRNQLYNFNYATAEALLNISFILKAPTGSCVSRHGLTRLCLESGSGLNTVYFGRTSPEINNDKQAAQEKLCGADLKEEMPRAVGLLLRTVTDLTEPADTLRKRAAPTSI